MNFGVVFEPQILEPNRFLVKIFALHFHVHFPNVELNSSNRINRNEKLRYIWNTVDFYNVIYNNFPSQSVLYFL